MSADSEFETLIADLHHSRRKVREDAAAKLGHLRDVRAVEPLLAAMQNDEDKDVRSAAAWALNNIQDIRALEPLIENLKGYSFMRSEHEGRVLDLVKQARDVGSIEPIIDSLRDSDEKTQQVAANALAWFKDASTIDLLIAVLEPARPYSAWTLGRMGEAAFQPLIDALNVSDADVRSEAARGLGHSRDRRAVEPLLERLSDNQIRQHAALALGEIGDGRAIDALTAALSDDDYLMRCCAANSLSDIHDPRIAEPLIAVLNNVDEYWGTRRAAIFGLLAIRVAGAFDLFMAALHDSDQEVRAAGARALGYLGDERAIEPLIAAWDDEFWGVWEEIPTALVEIGDAAIKPLIVAAKHPDLRVREAIAETLDKLDYVPDSH